MSYSEMSKDELFNAILAAEKALDLLREDFNRIPDEWQPQGGSWYVSTAGTVHDGDSSKPRRENGVERKTKTEAIMAARKMKSFSRALAFVSEHSGFYEFKHGQRNHCIVLALDSRRECTSYVSSHSQEVLGAVYMPIETAIELSKLINQDIFTK